MTEVQARYRIAAHGFDATVKAVTPQQWGLQSPCEGWTARDIVSHIVTEHNGQIRVEDNQPTGARFTIEIPALVEAEAVEPRAVAAAKA